MLAGWPRHVAPFLLQDESSTSCRNGESAWARGGARGRPRSKADMPAAQRSRCAREVACDLRGPFQHTGSAWPATTLLACSPRRSCSRPPACLAGLPAGRPARMPPAGSGGSGGISDSAPARGAAAAHSSRCWCSALAAVLRPLMAVDGEEVDPGQAVGLPAQGHALGAPLQAQRGRQPGGGGAQAR